MNHQIFRKLFFFTLCFSLAALFLVAEAQTNSDALGTVNISSESANSRIAPGEFLPVLVKLINFGSEKSVDVTVEYKIFDNAEKEIYLQREIYSESETVAVQTTASFVKRIQIPYLFKPGLYTLVTIIHYPYQQQPATSRLPFKVENKIGGFFQSDLMIYASFFLLVMAIVILMTYFFTNWRKRRVIFYDYSDKPKDQRVYYEMLSSIISQMRLHIGDDAIKITQDIPELKINPRNGLIEYIGDDPAKIVALLIFRYENLLGRPLSFGIDKNYK